MEFHGNIMGMIINPSNPSALYNRTRNPIHGEMTKTYNVLTMAGPWMKVETLLMVKMSTSMFGMNLLSFSMNYQNGWWLWTCPRRPRHIQTCHLDVGDGPQRRKVARLHPDLKGSEHFPIRTFPENTEQSSDQFQWTASSINYINTISSKYI